MLAERITGADLDQLADALFDAALCGIGELAGPSAGRPRRGRSARRRTWARWAGAHRRAGDVAPRPTCSAPAAAPRWARSSRPRTHRALWLAEGVRGGPAPADRGASTPWPPYATRSGTPARRSAWTRTRRWASRTGVAAGREAPPDLRGRGARVWAGRCGGTRRGPRTGGARRGVPASAGDWLAGLFALAREEVLHDRRHAGPARRAGRRDDRTRLPGGPARAAPGVRLLPAPRAATSSPPGWSSGAPAAGPAGPAAAGRGAGAGGRRAWHWTSASRRLLRREGLIAMTDPTLVAVAAAARRGRAAPASAGGQLDERARRPRRRPGLALRPRRGPAPGVGVTAARRDAARRR